MDDPAPDGSPLFDAVDALLWAVDRDPLLASIVTGVAIFDTEIAPAALRTRLERTTRLVPRMRQRVVGGPLSSSPPRWEFDPGFDVANHLEVVQCPGDGGMRELLDLAARFVAEPRDTDRPLFCYLLVQGFEAGQSALIMKAHHALADGVGTLAIQAELFDSEPNTNDPTDLPPVPGVGQIPTADESGSAIESQLRSGLGALVDIARTVTAGATGPTDVFDRAVDTVGSALRALQPISPLSPILVERS